MKKLKIFIQVLKAVYHFSYKKSLYGTTPLLYVVDDEKVETTILGKKYTFYSSNAIEQYMWGNQVMIAAILSDGKIAVDRLFFGLSDLTKTFILEHEVAHYLLNKLSGERNVKDEITCDMRAIEYLKLTPEEVEAVFSEIAQVSVTRKARKEIESRKQEVLVWM